jgi:hypothetical protein
MQIINLGSPSQFVRVTRDDYDLASAINAFEAGEMDAPEILQLFQLLVDNGPRVGLPRLIRAPSEPIPTDGVDCAA